MTRPEKEELHVNIKKEQFVPLYVPEIAYASAAKSAEPSSLAITTNNSEEHEFRLNMPVFPDDELQSFQNERKTVFMMIYNIANSFWGGIESLSTGVSDFLGVTSPRYDLWMEDSIKYQESLKTAETPLERENANFLKSYATSNI